MIDPMYLEEPDRFQLGLNPYQGSSPRALFVCTGGILRSPTCAHYTHRVLGWNTRSAGTRDDAIPQVSAHLVVWAQKIFCLEESHAAELLQMFPHHDQTKIRVLGIPDTFDYMDAKLLKHLEQIQFKELLV